MFLLEFFVAGGVEGFSAHDPPFKLKGLGFNLNGAEERRLRGCQDPSGATTPGRYCMTLR